MLCEAETSFRKRPRAFVDRSSVLLPFRLLSSTAIMYNNGINVTVDFKLSSGSVSHLQTLWY